MDFNEVKHQIEEFFNGKFEVKKFLGEGSFAKVYLVKHNYLDELMAMKIIKEPLSITTNRKDVFREVTLVCHLRHENIISIYDAAEIYAFEDFKNHAYFVMEYVSGGDLEQYLNSFSENNMFMPLNRSLDLIKQLLKGLNTLHSANPPIIHRDLKPNNVLLSLNAMGDIIIKLSDFGFAKEVTTSISDIDIAGTRPYMAPEIFNKSISTKTDIYAIGVIFYQLLTNHYPYNVDTYSNEEIISLKPWEESLKSPSFYNEEVFEELDEIVLKCLEFNPENRYLDAEELLIDVEKAIDKYASIAIFSQNNLLPDYDDDYTNYIINDSVKKAFELAKCENRLQDAIEILESEVLKDYDIRKYYSETLRIWKSKRPDVKLISKAFTVNLKGKNYTLSCELLKEAIAYNPSIKNKYIHFIDLWEIFIDLQNHGSLFKSVTLLENLMEKSNTIKKIYENIIPTLKTYSIDEIVVKSLNLVKSNDLMNAANLMEFAVVCDRKTKDKYAYRLSLWKQNMKMHFKTTDEVKQNTIDYAIDLGTTDSVISYFNKGNPVIIKNYMTGDEFTPSSVLIDNQNNIQVGIKARDAVIKNSSNAVSEFKNDMGFPISFKFEESSREMFPEELSAIVLRELRWSAYKQCGVDIQHAVISVPANANPLKTRAINDAANIAGFRSHNLILEPIAVGIAYNLRKDNGYWMVYDLGGGTFNVTLIHDNYGEIEKFATKGLDNFGGNSFDLKIVNELLCPKVSHDLNLNDFKQDNPIYFDALSKLRYHAEKAKKELSKNDMVDISIDNLLEGYDFNYTLMKKDFKEIIEPLVKYSFNLCRSLLNENSLEEENIEKIILVGGSCLSPIIQELITDEFNIEIMNDLNPLTVVSRGASIYAGNLEKPNIEYKKENFSLIINQINNMINGKVFCLDDKFSFFDYSIEFKNDNYTSGKIPLNSDSTFNVRLPQEKLYIRLYNGNVEVALDEKSPNVLDGESIYIPFLNNSFKISDEDLIYENLFNEYLNILKELEMIKKYSYNVSSDLIDYIDRLFEIAQKDKNALNQCRIYLIHLKKYVNDLKDDSEHSILLENLKNKIRIIEQNNNYKINEDYENKNLDELREYYDKLIGKYVELNKINVLEECFFNLKFEGIYTKNEKSASRLIEKANIAYSNNEYKELFAIIKLLYKFDERKNSNFNEAFI